MKRKFTLVIRHLTNDEAGAIMGLVPDTADLKLETESNGHRRKDGAPRKQGVTKRLLEHLAQAKLPISRERIKKLAENYGAKNPSAAIYGIVTAGYCQENSKKDKYQITAAGRAWLEGGES